MARKKRTSKAAPTDDVRPHPPEGGAGGDVIVRLPPKLGKRLGEVLAITDRFCDEHLDAEYKGLCRDMAAALCVEGFPLTSGKSAGWAAGVVYSVGWVNFIGDPSQRHHMKMEDMAPALGVSPATLMNRARDIREGLGLVRMDPRWSTKALLERNPLLRVAELLAGDEGACDGEESIQR
jgi:hypothetical protein